MLRSVRVYVHGDKLSSIGEATSESEVDGIEQVLADAYPHVFDVEAEGREVCGRGDSDTMGLAGEKWAERKMLGATFICKW